VSTCHSADRLADHIETAPPGQHNIKVTGPCEKPRLQDALRCQVCGGAARLFDVVDFNKSCEEARGKFLPLSGAVVYYARCDACGFCYAPEFRWWTPEDFRRHIYNDGYSEVDPDYAGARPAAQATLLRNLFGGQAGRFRHLDYGGGLGLLSRQLREAAWDSSSYDPFIDASSSIAALGQYDFITAFEVFEHVADPNVLMRDVKALLAPGGLVMLSTGLSDGKIVPGQRLTWWYASPRNGHISLFSGASLRALAHNFGLSVCSLSDSLHFLLASIPEWAAHIFQVNGSSGATTA
jgi:SAM-dependent methyltransferase